MVQIVDHRPTNQPTTVMRLEQFVAGMACSVSFFCRANEQPIACPPMQQILSRDGNLQYLGGQRIMDSQLTARATRLGHDAIRAMPNSDGYMGVDIILGEDESGDQDFVIELNPRLTTSYIGLRRIANSNLAQAMIDIALGREPTVCFSDRFVAFDGDGTVR